MRQEYTISHTGSVLEEAGEDAVTRWQNQVSPQRLTEILEFECPTNFDQISYVGKRDPVRFQPRTKETFTGDGTKDTFTVEARMLPVAGEDALEDQPYPAVQAVVDGSVAEVASVDYATGEVTLASTPADTVDVFLYPIITEGHLKIRGLNTLGQSAGPVYPWGKPLYRWHDMEQDKRGTQVNLNGAVTWQRNEKIQIMVDSPRQIVWEDAAYPESYVSTFEMDVEIGF